MSAPTANSYEIDGVELPVFDNRVAFANTLIELAKTDERIVAVCNDSVGSSNLGGFREQFPDRLINVGIAEQNMVGVGAGLANAGMIPFVCAAGPFLSGRATEQVKADVAYSNFGVILCAMSPGMAYGELGPTHHSVEDLSWMRALPNLDIVMPADELQTQQAVKWAVETRRPTYLRVGRHRVPNLVAEGTPFTRGAFVEMANGNDVTIIAAGSMVSRAMGAAAILKKHGVNARVLNATFIAPLDEAAIKKAAKETRGIVTVEEANVAGGLGAAVASLLGTLGADSRVPLRIVGTDDWSPTLSTDGLYTHFGLTAENIVAQVNEVLARD
ncbi:MAG: transketolase family protein [Micrococcales bacterium]